MNADNRGRLDDDQERQETSSTTDGPAAAGEYDAAQGSPDSGTHPTRDREAGMPRSDADEGSDAAD
ncbi:hypothetical protein [Nocardioides sp. TF02-7]|uniref:hypothetical protein n=1 Tax=Nocardioides sp. TF02-7 TaxID=2917724 RepID=UPI001F06B5B1|nr:hypothetical protein [Nocardioides sp. TF02-7]UMG93745.1 hypothetical protein MF408_06185 [Nocardioides sp. TF02-7]